MITQKQLDELVRKWGEPNLIPQYRRPTCANCGKTMYFGMWHCFIKEYGYKREVHLCKRCGKKYNLK